MAKQDMWNFLKEGEGKRKRRRLKALAYTAGGGIVSHKGGNSEGRHGETERIPEFDS